MKQNLQQMQWLLQLKNKKQLFTRHSIEIYPPHHRESKWSSLLQRLLERNFLKRSLNLWKSGTKECDMCHWETFWWGTTIKSTLHNRKNGCICISASQRAACVVPDEYIVHRHTSSSTLTSYQSYHWHQQSSACLHCSRNLTVTAWLGLKQ